MNYPDSEDLQNGKFTDGDPVAGISASIASADHMNVVYDELTAAIVAGGLTPDMANVAQLAASIGNQIRSKRLFDVSGTADAIVLTSPAGQQPVKALNDMDELSFIASGTNTTGVVTLTLDGLAAVNLSGVVSANQVFETALITVRYIAGSFYIANQINPKTGNKVQLIGKLIWEPLDVMSAGEIVYDGSEYSRAAYPILFAKAQASGLFDQATKGGDPKKYGGMWGDGDGSATFSVPNYLGAFIRGVDGGRGLDATRLFGSWQGDAIRNITASWADNSSPHDGTGAIIVETSPAVPRIQVGTGYDEKTITFDASRVVPTGADNRPMNYALYPKTLV